MPVSIEKIPLNEDWSPSKREVILAVSWLALLIFFLINASNKTIALWGAVVLVGLTVIGLFWVVQSLWRVGNRRGAVGSLGLVAAAIAMLCFLAGGDVEQATTRVGIGFVVGGFLGCIRCLWTAARQRFKKKNLEPHTQPRNLDNLT